MQTKKDVKRVVSDKLTKDILSFIEKHIRMDGRYCGGVILPPYKPEVKFTGYEDITSKKFKIKAGNLLWEHFAYKLSKHLYEIYEVNE